MSADLDRLMARAAPLQRAALHETHLFTPQTTISGGTERIPPVRTVAADSVLGKALTEARLWSDEQLGVALIVMIDGDIVSEHYGAEAGPDVKLNSMSMHKSVLALTVLAACEDGLIPSLDCACGAYLDDWSEDARGAITLRRLMQMASGLELLPYTSRDPRALELVYGTDIDVAARELSAASAPGQGFVYNNANSQLVGQILSGILAQSGNGTYADYLSRRVWQPLGNRDATLWLDRPDGAPHYAMNLHATARDWARIGELIRNRGRVGNVTLLSSDAINMLVAPSETNAAYGLHIWRGAEWIERREYVPGGPMTAYHSAPFLADDLVYFDGFGGQRVYVAPSCGLTIVRIGIPNLAYDDAIIPNGIIAALRSERTGQ